MTELGYVRVSTGQQVLAQQREALLAAGIDDQHIFQDTISSVTSRRPGLDALLAYARSGDSVTVVRMDRLGRSLSMIFQTIELLTERGIALRSLTENIDNGTTPGRMMIGILATFSGYERDLMRERLHEARASVEAGGGKWGRPPALTSDQAGTARKMRAAGIPVTTIAKTLGCSKASAYRYTDERAS